MYCQVFTYVASKIVYEETKRKKKRKEKSAHDNPIWCVSHELQYISSYVFFCNYDRFYPKESIDSFAFPHRVGITNRRCSVEIASNDGRGWGMHIEREREREKSLLRTSLLKLPTTKTTALVANRTLIRYRAEDTIIFEIEIPSSFLRLPVASIAGKSICFPSYDK